MARFVFKDAAPAAASTAPAARFVFKDGGPRTVASHTPGAPVEPERTPLGVLGGLGETALALGTGAVAYPAGLAVGAIDMLRGQGSDVAAREKRAVQNTLTYEPRTEEGKGSLRTFAEGFEPWTKSAEWVGHRVGEATGMPNLGGAAEEAFGAVANPLALLALRGRGPIKSKELIAPRAAETPAAALLRSHGVEGLTTGQRAGPDSFLGQLESNTADSFGGLGPKRAAAEQSWRQQVIRQSMKDKSAPLPSDTPGALESAYRAFDVEYGPLEAARVDPAKLPGLTKAAEVPGRGVPDATRARAAKVVEEALSTLKDEHGNLPSVPTVGHLKDARSYIRKERTRARANQNPDHAYLDALDHAEGVVSRAMNDALTPEQAGALAEIDKRYAKYSTVEKAAPRGRDDFTPGQLLRAAESSSGRRAAKHGRGGALQGLGKAAGETFVDAPFTGGRNTVLSYGSKYWGPMAARLANTPSVQRFLFDPRTRTVLTPQQNPELALAASALARAMAGETAGPLGIPRLRLRSAAAEEEDR